MNGRHDFHDEGYVRGYVAGINERRPERREMFAHVAGHVDALPVPAPHLVELAPGSGMLAEVLLRRLPDATWEGIDFSLPMVDLARRTLAPFSSRVELHHADLLRDDWPSLPRRPVHAVLSNMALHDLGSAGAVASAYEKAVRLLEPDGLLLNADLVLSPAPDTPPRGGRLPVEHHLALLRNLGLAGVRCTLAFDGYACLAARTPPQPARKAGGGSSHARL